MLQHTNNEGIIEIETHEHIIAYKHPSNDGIFVLLRAPTSGGGSKEIVALSVPFIISL